MSKPEKSLTSIFPRMIDVGVKEEFSVIEKRYLRVTNIAAILGASFNAIWMLITIITSEAPLVYGSNASLGLLFLLVLFFNKKGWRVTASAWLAVSALTSVAVFLYLLGYSSGVASACFLIIIMPYITFPRHARKFAHGFSVLACLILILSVIFQDHINPHYEGMDPYLSQVVNISIVGLICFVILSSLSVLIDESEDSLKAERQRSDDLLHNILPVKVAKDLKETGKTLPERHESVTILFTDFQDFTELVASIPAITLVDELNDIFGHFDEIMEETQVEKIETIGDAYMAACGLDDNTENHALQCIKAAKRMLAFLEARNKKSEINWKMRVGIHSGPIVAGVVGKKKFNYDLFGDTINTASRMESSGEAGMINISETTYELVKNEIECEPRGKLHAKGKGDLEMYFVK